MKIFSGLSGLPRNYNVLFEKAGTYGLDGVKTYGNGWKVDVEGAGPISKGKKYSIVFGKYQPSERDPGFAALKVISIIKTTRKGEESEEISVNPSGREYQALRIISRAVNESCGGQDNYAKQYLNELLLNSGL